MRQRSHQEVHHPSPKPRRIIRLLAVTLGVVPIYSLVVFMHLTAERAYTAWEMVLFPLTFGAATIGLIILLQKLLVRERLAALNCGKGNWLTDLGWALTLLAALFGLFYIEMRTIYQWLPHNGGQFNDLLTGMLENPLILILWFGPVVWIGVAVFEELTRVFILHHLTQAWPGWLGKVAVVVLAALIFAIGHLYQGPAGMMANFLSGLLKGVLYIRLRRFWPLVIAHALWDTLQVGLVLIRMQQDMGV